MHCIVLQDVNLAENAGKITQQF